MAGVKTTAFARNRGLGHASVTYRFNDWLSVTGRTGRDWYQNHFRANYPVNDISPLPQGGFNDAAETHSETNSDFLVTANHQLVGDWSVTVNAGGNARGSDLETDTSNVHQLVIPGGYTVSNSAGGPGGAPIQSQKKGNPLYGRVRLTLNDRRNVDG